MEKLLLVQRPPPRAGRAVCPRGVPVLVGPSNPAGLEERHCHSPEPVMGPLLPSKGCSITQHSATCRLSQTVPIGFSCDLKNEKRRK